MGEIRDLALDVYRDQIAPGSGMASDPEKSRIRALWQLTDERIAGAAGGLTVYQTVAQMNASGQTDGLAVVVNNNGSASDAANGPYQPNGSGGWTAADWYYDGVSVVVTPLVSAAEGARVGAELALDQTRTLVANGDNLRLIADGDDIKPLWADQGGGVLLGVRTSNGEAVGHVVEQMRPKAPNLCNFSGLGQVQPIIADVRGGVFLGVNVATGEPVGSMVTVMRSWSSGGDALPADGVLAASERPAVSGWTMALSYGQSLSIGAQGQPPLSTTQPYANLTFVGGPKTAAGAGTASAKPLVEDSLGEGGDAGGNRGETLCSGMANYAVQLAAVEAGIAPSNLVIFSSAPGQGGTPIAGLNRGTTVYARLLAHVSSAASLASAAGRSFSVGAVAWLQGENDAEALISRADYRALLMQLADDLDADVRAITGQSSPVHLLIYQTVFKVVSSAGAVALAQMDAVNDHKRIHFVAPVYGLPHNGDGVHLVNTGYLWAGRLFGRALKQLVVDGRRPDCIWPLSATAEGQTVRVRFRVPTAPLAFNTTDLAATANNGFRVVDDTGVLTLSAMQVVDGSVVQMTVNRALGANPRVRYALDALGAGLTITSGASGNLVDSTPGATRVDGVSRSLRHVSPHFELSILKMDANA